MHDKTEILQTISGHGLLPLFYHDDEGLCIAVVQTLYKAGIRAIEFTNRGPAAVANFKALKKIADAELPGLALGTGTIKTAADANAFIAAGTDFIVSPIIDGDVAKAATDAGLLFIPGCMTPTEIALAQSHDAALIKLFPAGLLRPDYVSAVKELFPGQRFLPTGGIEFKDLNAWFKAGVFAVGLGSKLISKTILEQRAFDQLYDDTVAALSLIKNAKSQTSA